MVRGVAGNPAAGCLPDAPVDVRPHLNGSILEPSSARSTISWCIRSGLRIVDWVKDGEGRLAVVVP